MRGFGQPQLDGVLVGAGRFAAGDVHRIAGGAEGRNELAEGGVEVVGHGHQRQLVVDAGVGEQDAGTAGAGDDDHVLALGRRQRRNAAGELEQVAQAAGADHAGLAQHVLVDLVVAGQGPGVRTGGAGAGLGAAGFEHDHRLLLRDAPCRLGEGAAVLEILAVLGDDLGVVVLLEEGEQVVFVDVRTCCRGRRWPRRPSWPSG